MARHRRPRPPAVVQATHLDEKHTVCVAPDGREWRVRGAPVGATLEVAPGPKGEARRIALHAPAAEAVAPACPVFGVCGGCQLQEMPLDAQRREKSRLLPSLVGIGAGDAAVAVHALRGAPGAYRTRNKLELSWGTRRYQPEAERLAAGADAPAGSFLGFHPAGWFGKIVPVSGCPLGTAAMDAAIARVAALGLGPAWDTRAGQGAWRHLVLRDTGTADAPHLLVALVTSSAVTDAEMDAVADALDGLPGLAGLLHIENDGLAEVATGRLRRVLRGAARLDVTLAGRALEMPWDAFFQVNLDGAAHLIDTIAEAFGPAPANPEGTLYDLYCGVGALGFALAPRYARLVGVELHAPAIDTARDNAARLGISGEWHAGPVEEVLPRLAPPGPGPVHLLVDPPRVGLHPKAARFLAAWPAEALVYVACGPRSLARDRVLLAEGGWRLDALWGVDLFPQTHHVEAVARFVRG